MLQWDSSRSPSQKFFLFSAQRHDSGALCFEHQFDQFLIKEISMWSPFAVQTERDLGMSSSTFILEGEKKTSNHQDYNPSSPSYDLKQLYSPAGLSELLQSISLALDPQTKVQFCCGEKPSEMSLPNLNYCYGCETFWRCFKDDTHLKCSVCQYRRCLSPRCASYFRSIPCLGCGLYHCYRDQDDKCLRCLYDDVTSSSIRNSLKKNV